MAKANLHNKRHKRLYAFFRLLLSGIFSYLYAYKYEKVKLTNEPCLIVCNHNTDLDPVLLALAFDHVYFVASDHIFRLGFISKLLVFLTGPIPRRKATVSSSTVLEMKRRIMAGNNVCIFAEGERSYDGNTLAIHPTMGKLIKSMKATLVTYRITGGYFTSPRWSFKRRRGKMQGEVRGIYPYQDLAQLTPNDIIEKVQRDISENAYEEQAKNPIPYHGKTLTHGLETALYFCPSCNALQTLKTERNQIYCQCGFASEIDLYGYFSAPAPKTFTEWYTLQRDHLRKQLSEGKLPAFRESVTLFLVNDESKEEITSGVLTISPSSLAVGENQKYQFALEDLPLLGMHGRNSLVFAHNDAYYEIRAHKLFNARYYLHIYDYYKGNAVNR